jgi:hypothetical protein
VAYGFDAEHLVVWLDAFHVAQGARSGVLCRRHANAMVVPLGWMLDDRREPEPRLFQAPPPVIDEPVVKKRRVQRPVVVEQLRLDTVDVPVERVAPAAVAPVSVAPVSVAPVSVAPASASVAPVDSDGHAAEPADASDDQAAHDIAPWMPQFDQHDDLKGLLNARGRLLSRAFNGLGLPADD